MAWLLVLLAGAFEISLTLCMKYADGYTKLLPTIGTFASAALGFFVLGFAVKSIPIGTAYSIWVGIGIVGTTLAGIFLFGETASISRLGCIAMILAGIVGLKLLPAQ
ncbi:MAG: multidrug efflux SMR transporter [Polyangiaceae bacterium]